jgi:IclR family acetate operon transcriptional repressor
MAGNAVDRRPVTAKVAAILTAFNAGRSYQMTDLARHAGLPMTTAHRLIHELIKWGFLSREPDGTLRVGPAIQQLACDLPPPPRLEDRAPHVVEDLVEVLRRPVRLGVLDGLAVSYIKKAPGYTPVTSFGPAARLPAHATALGKALLAFAPAEILRLVETGCLTAYTCRTLVRPDQLVLALHMVRRDGVATCRGELTTGKHAIAVPVLGPDALAYAGIEVEVETVTPDLIARVAPTLRLASHALNHELHPNLRRRPAVLQPQPLGVEHAGPALADLQLDASDSQAPTAHPAAAEKNSHGNEPADASDHH